MKQESTKFFLKNFPFSEFSNVKSFHGFLQNKRFYATFIYRSEKYSKELFSTRIFSTLPKTWIGYPDQERSQERFLPYMTVSYFQYNILHFIVIVLLHAQMIFSMVKTTQFAPISDFRTPRNIVANQFVPISGIDVKTVLIQRQSVTQRQFFFPSTVASQHLHDRNNHAFSKNVLLMYPDSRHLNDYIELGITIQMHAPTVVLFGNAERELVTSTTSD